MESTITSIGLLPFIIYYLFCVAKETCTYNKDEFELVHVVVGPKLWYLPGHCKNWKVDVLHCEG